MSDHRPPQSRSTLLAALALAAWCGSVDAQSTASFALLDNVEGDFVNLNAFPVRPMAMSADEQTLYALNTHASRIVSFDLVTGATNDVFHTAKSPVSIALWEDPDDEREPERLVVVCRGTYALLIHDRVTGDVREVLELRDPATGQILGEPGDLLIDECDDRAFVSCQTADAVAEIDLTGPSVVAVHRIPGKNPLFLCFEPYQDCSDGRNVLVAPLLSGNNSGARRRDVVGINPMHEGPTVVDFEIAAQNGTKLPDEDLFRIVRTSPPVVEAVTTDVGTIQFACGINPATGHLWQLNTDANNKDSSRQTEASIQGDIVVNQLSISTLPAVGQPKTAPLARIDLDQVTGGYDPTRSVGQPYALAFGQFGYAVVAGLLTDNVMLLSPTGAFVSEFDLADGAIPRALLYSAAADRVIVYCWGTNTVDVRQVGLSWTQVHNLSLGLDPTPPQIQAGRKIAYDAAFSEKNNASCFSCHVEGRTDMIAWNLSKETDDKGPMITQTLDGINKTVPFHWRGEQQNNLSDFRPAFSALLGASVSPDDGEFADFEAFILSLETPPNPFEDHWRRVSNAIQPNLRPTSPLANAVNGQVLFNQAGSCEGCHNAPIATSNDSLPDGAEFGDTNPRRKFLKIAPFNEHYRKDFDADPVTAGMQLHSVDLVSLTSPPQVDTLEYSALGVGFLHAGLAPSLQEFVDFFVDGQDLSDVTSFVWQFDQGIGPAAYRAVKIDQLTAGTAGPEMTNYFVPQAEARHCDLVVFGKYTAQGGAVVPMRWWFDRTRSKLLGRFVPEDGGPTREASFFVAQAQNGQASLTCVGLPVGTGEGFGIDFDRDEWANRVELANVPPGDPDDSDSDNDTWLDGHEVNNLGNPLNAGTPSNDTTPPVILRKVTQFVTGKVARINVETNEPCVIQATYSRSGGPVHTVTTSVYGTTHSLVLNDLDATVHLPPAAPNYLNYSGTLKAIDLAALSSTLHALPQMPSFHNAGPGPITTRTFNDFSGVAVVGSLAWTNVTKNTSLGTLSATARVRVDDKVSGPPKLPLSGKRVVARIFKNGVLQSAWTPQGTSIQLTGFNVTELLAGLMVFDAFGGPFLVSTATSTGTPLPAGTAELQFSMTGLALNDEITVNIELIGVEDPVHPFLTFTLGSLWNMASTPAQNRDLSLTF